MAYFDHDALRDTVTAQAIEIQQLRQDLEGARAGVNYWENKYKEAQDAVSRPDF